jgi:hypothetical protein
MYVRDFLHIKNPASNPNNPPTIADPIAAPTTPPVATPETDPEPLVALTKKVAIVVAVTVDTAALTAVEIPKSISASSAGINATPVNPNESLDVKLLLQHELSPLPPQQKRFVNTPAEQG